MWLVHALETTILNTTIWNVQTMGQIMTQGFLAATVITGMCFQKKGSFDRYSRKGTHGIETYSPNQARRHSKPYLSKINPSILEVAEGLQPISAVMGWKAGYTLLSYQSIARLTHTDNNSSLWIDITSNPSLNCGRKPEHSDKNHKTTEKIKHLHKNSILFNSLQFYLYSSK